MKRTTMAFGMAGVLALAGAGVGGCAATTPSEPTHYWEAADAVTKLEYNRSHAGCSESAGVSLGEDAMDSPSFQDYLDCMIEQGYTLQTY